MKYFIISQIKNHEVLSNYYKTMNFAVFYNYYMVIFLVKLYLIWQPKNHTLIYVIVDELNDIVYSLRKRHRLIQIYEQYIIRMRLEILTL